MTFVTVFLLNMLCSAFNCEYENPLPTHSPPLQRSGRAYNNRTDSQPLIVFTKSGALEGFPEMATSGKQMTAFEGVPFAEPPIGPLRFRSPVPKKPWTGIRQAKAPGPDCLQLRAVAHGKEDCLYLNIYTPKVPVDGEKLDYPVLFWIYGGSFIWGTGRHYGPAYLLNNDVILVTSNYRMGVLGFMSTGDEASPGNYGLKDQALAIKWIHDNIAVFGGDPNRITVMGQSAGAASAHLQIISPTSVARGLIHSAASLSGTAFNVWALQTPSYARKLTTRLAKILSCPVDSGSQAIVDCFRKTNGNFLVSNQFHLFEIILFPVVLFGPAIEPNTTEAFISDTAENYYARNEVAKIPWLCTVTEHEAEFAVQGLRNVVLLLNYMIHYRRYMPIMLDLVGRVDDVDYVLDEIIKAYFGDQDPSRADPKIWAQIATDRYFQVPNRKALSYHSKIAPTYSYLFGFTSRVGVTRALTNDYRDWGSSHSEDLSTLFNSTIFFPPLLKGEPAYEMMMIMTNLFTNFISKGIPYYTNENGMDQVIWDSVKDPDHPKFLRLNTGQIQMISDPFAERLKVWQSVGLD
jgi:carboxylesterase type B